MYIYIHIKGIDCVGVACFCIILDADFGTSRWLMEEADAQVAAIKAAEEAENAEFEKKRRRQSFFGDMLGTGDGPLKHVENMGLPEVTIIFKPFKARKWVDGISCLQPS